MLLFAAIVIAPQPPSLGQPNLIDYYQFDPLVVSREAPVDVRLEVKLNESVSRVSLVDGDIGLPEIVLLDDGKGPDLQAHDGIYSAILPGLQVVTKLNPRDVHRLFVGFLDAYEDSTRILRVNIFLDVVTDEVPAVTVIRDAEMVQHAAYLVNIRDKNYRSDGDDARIARTFYAHFPDSFDFLNIISTIPKFENRHHFGVQNSVLGISLTQFDRTIEYGSSGRLLGISVFPVPTIFDAAETGFLHELGHQWINFLTSPLLRQGQPHWPLSSMASGIMGWSIPPTNQGGSFPCSIEEGSEGFRLVRRLGEPVYSDFDLYLMGLLPPEGVSPGFVFTEQGLDAASSLLALCDGRLYDGVLQEVTVHDVINTEGPRLPHSSAAPKSFTNATIIVSRDRLLDDNEMRLYSYFAQRGEARTELPFRSGFLAGNAKPFYVATRGLGVLSMLVDSEALCADSPFGLCLNRGRFRVELDWRTPQGGSGRGTVARLTDDTGYSWFFDAANVEVVFKVLDACPFFGHFWFFAGGLTNVEVEITVTDTHSGRIQRYKNDQGSAFQPIQDTSAFATCP